MRLDELIDGIDVLDMSNIYPDMEIATVTCDSRQVGPGSAFVAIPGVVADGHDFIEQALANGATLVIQMRPIDPSAIGSFVRVKSPREVYALLCARLAGYPSRRLRVIGVTGTNGKTSTVLITRHLLNQAGYRCAALGTLGLLRPDSDDYEMRGLTTPDAGQLQQILGELADAGTTHLVMEVSSHALSQHRVDGVDFAGAAFTNLTQDHYDYHETREAYFAAKASLFLNHLVISGGYAVINTDDDAGRDLASRFSGIDVRYGTEPVNNLVMMNIRNSIDGLSWEMVLKNGVWPATHDPNVNHAELRTPLVGRYNVYNCAAACGIALLEGLSLTQLVEGLSSFQNVPGRLQQVPNDKGLYVFVDYAHTPDALENVLGALSEVRRKGARILTVIGCGGDRDRAKRPMMGEAAQRLSDIVIVTSDNPRSEDPGAIIDQIFSGIDEVEGKVFREIDRRKAIQRVLADAASGDVVLIAGKGHEDYQILAEETVVFCDAEVATAYLGRTVSKL